MKMLADTSIAAPTKSFGVAREFLRVAIFFNSILSRSLIVSCTFFRPGYVPVEIPSGGSPTPTPAGCAKLQADRQNRRRLRTAGGAV